MPMAREVPRRHEEFRPDLLLIDMMMPYLNGMALLEIIQRGTPGDDYVPVLVITGDSDPETRNLALSHGAKDFIRKPIDRREVVLRVENLLDMRFRHLQFENQAQALKARFRQCSADLGLAEVTCLQGLARAAEYRDDATGHHIQRVGRLAGLLGIEMGLPEDRVGLLHDAATLHDIGKIGIPDSILLKPGKLTNEEFEQMKAHTRIGAEILAGSHFPVLAMAEKIALYHHERWDGYGYGQLAGKAIPIEARIVCLADTFDVLTHDRPYRAAWSVSDALAEIRRQKERQFDPRIVDTFCAALWLHELENVSLDSMLSLPTGAGAGPS